MQDWALLGFTANPYDTQHLTLETADKTLFYGRQNETKRLISLVRNLNKGIIAVLGERGIGKTSFFNFQQNILSRGPFLTGGRVLTTKEGCALSGDPKAIELARAIVTSVNASIQDYCQSQDHKAPKFAQQVDKWLSINTGSGFGFTIPAYLGTGGGSLNMQRQFSSVGDADISTFSYVFRLLVQEAESKLHVRSIFISIENLEGLASQQVADLFIPLRDRFFSVDGAVFVLMGPLGMVSDLQRCDRRFGEWISQPPIELRPFTSEQLHELVELRMIKYRPSSKQSPMSHLMHDIIFRCSNGNSRLALNQARTLMNRVFEENFQAATQAIEADEIFSSLNPSQLEALILDALQAKLVDGGVSDSYAYGCLLENALIKIFGDADSFKDPIANFVSLRFRNESDGPVGSAEDARAFVQAVIDKASKIDTSGDPELEFCIKVFEEAGAQV